MSAQTRTTLKGYFNTGDKPTEGQFENLIDSNLNLTDGGTVAGDTTHTGILTHTNASGKYINGMNTVVKRVGFTGSSANSDSGAIYLPDNTYIEELTVICVEALAFATATVGVSWGSAAGGTQYTGTLDADSYIGSNTAIALGVGNSTLATRNTELGGQAAVALAAGAHDIASAAEIHGRVVASTGAFTDGTVAFVVRFLYLGGN